MRQLLRRVAGSVACLLATSCAVSTGSGSASVTIEREIILDAAVGDIGTTGDAKPAPKRGP
jgi:hypothetical protein